MKIPLYQIDAFTDRPFGGNPAAVCPLDKWLSDELMQSIAFENNLAETAFFVRSGDRYDLRWFTPTTEVDLCGHATLAAAYVFFNHYNANDIKTITFHTQSGPLTVTADQGLLVMEFPSRPAIPCEIPEDLIVGLGGSPHTVLKARDYLAVFDTAEEIRSLTPDFTRLQELDCLGVIVSAPGDDCDFVSRFFAPKVGVPEDPVTGSAHCTLIPYWSRKLGRQPLDARQLSQRGGRLYCHDLGRTVTIAGTAVPYLAGTITI